MKKHKIVGVMEYSIAAEMGIEVGDYLISINNENIQDVFDYRFLLADEFIEIIIEKTNREQWVIEIEKDYNEDLGLVFETELMDELIRCKNKCKFCFIDQLPHNMRETVYFKDDDWRMSFLNGNYITLTNMSELDFERLIKYKLSPINISIHASDPKVRQDLLKNPRASEIISQIKRLVEGGIKINGQIVLCKGINDGDILNRTISDLSQFIPNILSLTIVPVGISKFREKLEYLEPFDKESASVVLDTIHKWQKYYFAKMDTRFVFAADEFYIVGEHKLPEYEEYEDFPVLDNGVGMLAKFRRELVEELDNSSGCLIPFKSKPSYELGKHSTVRTTKRSETNEFICVTGLITVDFMKQNVELIKAKIGNINIEVVGVTNKYFGENITVTGLLTGQDIIYSLKNKNISNKVLLIAENMLKCEEEVFLDNYTVKDVEKSLNCTIQIMPTEGNAWVQRVMEDKNE
ncbi:MAG: hypothetical protein BEN18_01790 [Epulopiscium sp. Nuni2H_MBin001]|nr:MAG: hypothetical protein BEN18_01790 [Epulopiscium sp. Nuni2H_MBin001]